MTTIIVTDNVMYSDSQATLGDFVLSYDTQKLHHVNGCVVGFAGRYASCTKFLDWFERSTETEGAMMKHPTLDIVMPENLVEKDFTAMVLDLDGTVTVFEGSDAHYTVAQPSGIGSGFMFALSALDAGATGEEAIGVAIKRDVCTGGAIQTAACERGGHSEEELRAMDKHQLLTLIGVEDDAPEEEAGDVGDGSTPYIEE